MKDTHQLGAWSAWKFATFVIGLAWLLWGATFQTLSARREAQVSTPPQSCVLGHSIAYGFTLQGAITHGWLRKVFKARRHHVVVGDAQAILRVRDRSRCFANALARVSSTPCVRRHEETCRSRVRRCTNRGRRSNGLACRVLRRVCPKQAVQCCLGAGDSVLAQSVEEAVPANPSFDFV